MDKVKGFFHRHKRGESNVKAPNMPLAPTELTLLAEPWQGNLPCVHGPTDGCNQHNPRHHNVHFDPSLFGPDGSKIKPTGNLLDPDTPTEYTIPSISSHLPQSPALGCLITLPRIHKSLPHTLSFYHVHWLLSHRRNGTLDPAHLSTLYCVANTGQNPILSWLVSPLITEDNTLLMEYTMVFALEADLGAWSPAPGCHGRAAAKHALIGSGYRDFSPCLHTHVSFTSHKGEGNRGVRSAGVSFTRKMCDGREVKEDWDSERDKERDIEPLCCGKCYTDTVIVCKLIGSKTLVDVLVYKDLGKGKHPSDEKWLAAAKGAEVKREAADFLRMRRAYEAAHEESLKEKQEAGDVANGPEELMPATAG
ncbi:hypothetical protein VTI74DRAFT_2622 [Chaetomium olivicolor]